MDWNKLNNGMVTWESFQKKTILNYNYFKIEIFDLKT